MAISRKITINTLPAYVQVDKNPAGEVFLYWYTPAVLRKISMASANIDLAGNILSFSYMFEQFEILDMGTFDYQVPDPDFSLMNVSRIDQQRMFDAIPIPSALAANTDMMASTVSGIGGFVLNGAWHHYFANQAMEDILLQDGSDFRQPFYYEVAKTDQIDGIPGSIIITNAWGGNNTMQYSIDNGSTFQTDGNFAGLAPGTYQIVLQDGLNNKSIMKEVVIEDIVTQ